MMGWEQARQAVAAQAPDAVTQIMPPAGPTGYWRANQLEKTGQPTSSFDLLLDAYSGAPLYRSGWAEQTAFGKATAIGIPFHRGEYGLWNQALLVLFGSRHAVLAGLRLDDVLQALEARAADLSAVDAGRLAIRLACGRGRSGAVLMLAMPLLAVDRPAGGARGSRCRLARGPARVLAHRSCDRELT